MPRKWEGPSVCELSVSVVVVVLAGGRSHQKPASSFSPSRSSSSKRTPQNLFQLANDKLKPSSRNSIAINESRPVEEPVVVIVVIVVTVSFRRLLGEEIKGKYEGSRDKLILILPPEEQWSASVTFVCPNL